MARLLASAHGSGYEGGEVRIPSVELGASSVAALLALSAGCTGPSSGPDIATLLATGRTTCDGGGLITLDSSGAVTLASTLSTLMWLLVHLSVLVSLAAIAYFALVVFREARALAASKPLTCLALVLFGCGALWLGAVVLDAAWSRGFAINHTTIAPEGRRVVSALGRVVVRRRSFTRDDLTGLGVVYSRNKGGTIRALRMYTATEDVTLLRCHEADPESMERVRDWLAERLQLPTRDTRWTLSAW